MGMNDPASATQEQNAAPDTQKTDAAKTESAQTGVTMSMPTAEDMKRDAASNERRIAFEGFVPEAYKGKEWVQNIAKTESPIEELFKKTENAQSLIGRKELGIPGPDATPEQKQAYRKAIGVPDTAEEYVINPTTWDPEDKDLGQFVDKSRDPKLMAHMAKTCHDLDIPPEKLNKISEAYEKFMVKSNKELLQAAIKAEADAKDQAVDFKDKATKMFGNRYDSVLNNGRDLLMKHMDKSLKSDLETLDNKSLLILASALDGIHRAYVSEGTIGNAQPTGAARQVSEAQNTAERRALYADPAFKLKSHPRHVEVMAALERNDAELRQLRGVVQKK